MDGWILATALVVSLSVGGILLGWPIERGVSSRFREKYIDSIQGENQDKSQLNDILEPFETLFGLASSTPQSTSNNKTALKEEIEKSRKDEVSGFWGFTVLGIFIALIWISIWSAVAGFHWSFIGVFAWPCAVGYAWGRVSLKVALKQSRSQFVILSLILTILAITALFIFIDISGPFPSLFNTAFAAFSTGAIRWAINGYMLLGVSGLFLAVISLVMLARGTKRDYDAFSKELQHEIEEKERRERESIPIDVLRTQIKQLLDQGKKVSRHDFPDINENKVRNAMSSLELAFPSVAFEYNALETTLKYVNDEGVRRLQDLCNRVTQLAREVSTEHKRAIKEFVQMFLKELGLPDLEPEADVQLRHRYFPMVSARVGGSVQGLPAEFPVFVPLLNDQQMRERNISETFRQLFRAGALACNSGFGLILSPKNSPYLRSILTQRDEDGVKENAAYLDEEDIRAIITVKDLKPSNMFLTKVAQQVSFALISPFHTRGVTPGAAFVGRDREMSDIIRNIGSRSYVVLGARRIGKTSMIMQVMEQLKRRNYRMLYLDCQSVETYHDFFRNIRVQWANHLGTYPFVNDLPVTFQETVAYLSHSDPSHGPLVFIFDEIDRLLKFDISQENPEPLFRTFRTLSQQKMCQFIFSGERRISHQIHDTGSPLFNFPVPIKLGVFSLAEAQKLIEQPLSQFGISLEGGRSLTSIIVDACSCHPNLLQEVGHKVFEQIDRQSSAFDQKITKKMVSQVVNHPDFRKLYQEIFWGQSSSLEKAITLLAPPQDPIELAVIARQLKEYGFRFSQKQFDVALEFLILYCIFQQDSSDLRWAATHFKEIANKTIFDQEEYLVELCEQFSLSEDKA